MDAEERQAVVEKVVELLLTVPWEDREDVCSSIQYNGIFCWYCGYGSPERPNRICHCQNDE